MESALLAVMSDSKVTIAGILAMTLALFIWGRIRHDVVALMALLAALSTGVVKPDDAFGGLADPAVITVALVLVVSAAIRESGVLDKLTNVLAPAMMDTRTQIVLLVGAVVTLSAFMNNIGALAIVMPLAIASCTKLDRSPSVVLMPLAFGSLLGGLITLIGTPPNLLISSVRISAVGQPFSMFDFAPVGGAIALAGIAYLAVAWRLLPADRRGAPTPQSRFRIADYVTEVSVGDGSQLLGKTIGEAEEMLGDTVAVLAVRSGTRNHHAPPRSWALRSGDILVLEADSSDLKSAKDRLGLDLVGDKELGEPTGRGGEIGTIEAVVAGNSDLVGQSPVTLKLRDRGVNLLALSRRDRRLTRQLNRERFNEGDVIVLQGDLDHLGLMIRELGLLPLAGRQIELGRRSSRYLPIGMMAAAILATTIFDTPLVISFLAAVIVLALARVMRPNEMYEAIDPSIIVLMAALIPVTAAVQSSGATKLISDWIAATAQGWPPLAMLAIVLLATMALTPVLNNAATVLLMGPIGAGVAMASRLNPDPFLMAVAIGASCDFLTPFGHQSNTLVMAPGGYKFTDYTRVGAPLTMIVIIVSLLMIPMVWSMN